MTTVPLIVSMLADIVIVVLGLAVAHRLVRRKAGPDRAFVADIGNGDIPLTMPDARRFAFQPVTSPTRRAGQVRR